MLYPTMAKTQASQKGADDAWLLEDGFITEASSATAHIVKKDGTLITRDLSHVILPGITRASTLDLAREAGIKVEERPFTLEEAKDAAEAFNTSATNFVLPVVRIDGQKIGDGTPGPITKKLRRNLCGEPFGNRYLKTEPQGKMAQGRMQSPAPFLLHIQIALSTPSATNALMIGSTSASCIPARFMRPESAK